MFDIQKIQSAFSPAHEVRDPLLFVGCSDQIRRGMASLTNPGSCAAIFGLRGVGKSSMVRQLQRIAEGDRLLPDLLGLARYIPVRGFDFLTHCVKCDLATADVFALLKKMLFGDDTNSSLFTRTSSGEEQLAKFKQTLAAQREAHFFGVKLNGNGEPKEAYSPYISDSIVQQFQQLLGAIQRDNPAKSGLLILIDSLEALADKSGLVSIIQTCSSEYVRFVVAGTADSVTGLLPGSAAIGRQIEAIEILRMPDDELAQILLRAEEKVDRYFEFTQGARDTMVRQSEGFPFFMHLLGREALLFALDQNLRTIDKPVLEELNQRITGGRLGSIYEDLYNAAVKNSPSRETLLKLFAESTGDEIFSDEIYRIAREFEVTNPSQLMKELTSGEHGEPVLVKIREKYYRFSDPAFKVYARIRNWKFDASAKSSK